MGAVQQPNWSLDVTAVSARAISIWELGMRSLRSWATIVGSIAAVSAPWSPALADGAVTPQEAVIETIGARQLVLAHDSRMQFSLVLRDPAGKAPPFTLVAESHDPVWGTWISGNSEVVFVAADGVYTILRQDGSTSPLLQGEYGVFRAARLQAWIAKTPDASVLYFPVTKNTARGRDVSPTEDDSSQEHATIGRWETGKRTLEILPVIADTQPIVNTNPEQLGLLIDNDEAALPCVFDVASYDLTAVPRKAWAGYGVKVDESFLGSAAVLKAIDFAKVPRPPRLDVVASVSPGEVVLGSRGTILVDRPRLSPTTGVVIGTESADGGTCIVVLTRESEAHCIAQLKPGSVTTQARVRFTSMKTGAGIEASVISALPTENVAARRAYNLAVKQPPPGPATTVHQPKSTDGEEAEDPDSMISELSYPPALFSSPAELESKVPAVVCADISNQMPGTATYTSCFVDAANMPEAKFVSGAEYVFRDGQLYGVRLPLRQEVADRAMARFSKWKNRELRSSAPEGIEVAVDRLARRMWAVAGKPEAAANAKRGAAALTWKTGESAFSAVWEQGDLLEPYLYHVVSSSIAATIQLEFASLQSDVKNEIDGYEGLKWGTSLLQVKSRFADFEPQKRCPQLVGDNASVECFLRKTSNAGDLVTFVSGKLSHFSRTTRMADAADGQKLLSKLKATYGAPNSVLPAEGGAIMPSAGRSGLVDDVTVAWVGGESVLLFTMRPKEAYYSLQAWEKSAMEPPPWTAFPPEFLESFVYDEGRAVPASIGTTMLLTTLGRENRPTRVPRYTHVAGNEKNLERLRHNRMPFAVQCDYDRDGRPETVAFLSVRGAPMLGVFKDENGKPALWDMADLGSRMISHIGVAATGGAYVYPSFTVLEPWGLVFDRAKRKFILKRCSEKDDEYSEERSIVCK